MAIPVLIDTDMGVDDAMAIALAQASPDVDIVGLVSVGGNVSCEQATANLGRLAEAIKLDPLPMFARGLDQADATLSDASDVYADDGLGGVELPLPKKFKPGSYIDAYETLIAKYGHSLVIIAIGPLTNLAALQEQRPGLLEQAGRIIVMGGAVWCKGNITEHAEFNFYRDPKAVVSVVSAGLDVTVVPLDVTTQVVLDESHAAHLSCSGAVAGEVLAKMMIFPMAHDGGVDDGTFIVHDALAVGVVIWPKLFLRSKMGLDVATDGENSGQSKPLMTRDPKRKIGVVISAKADEFIEKMLECICHEKFIV